ncbi:MAG: GNAT family N-acetyltransferase [Thermodesulfobacteriota bacterium]
MRTADSGVQVSQLDLAEAGQVAELIADIISSLTYYNDRARSEEVAKYGPGQLVVRCQADPDSVLVAHQGNHPVGFCISRYDDGLIWIEWFGVKKEHRHRGIGGELLRALATTLGRRRAHKIWCDTRTENLPSQSVLTRVGFVRVAHLVNHWYGQDFFIWQWQP